MISSSLYFCHMKDAALSPLPSIVISWAVLAFNLVVYIYLVKKKMELVQLIRKSEIQNL